MNCNLSPSQGGVSDTRAVTPGMRNDARNGRRLSGLWLGWPLLFLPLAWSVGRLDAALLTLGTLVIQAALRRYMRARHSAKTARLAAERR